MKVECILSNGATWSFKSLREAKDSNALKSNVTLDDADEIITRDGEQIAVFK